MWQEVFQQIFFIEPASGNILIDLLLPSVLMFLFYGISFSLVGDMYGAGLIASSAAGSFFHWLIRLGLVYFVIFVFNLVLAFLISFLSLIAAVLVIFAYLKFK